MRRIILSLFVLSLFTVSDLPGQLRISEVMAVNSTGILNPVTGEPSDWIEIRNHSSSPVQVGGYHLSDDEAYLTKWKFPQNTVIPSGGYLLVWADGTNDTLNGLHTNFKLNAAGEILQIRSAAGSLVDLIAYPRMYEDVSYGVAGDGIPAYFRIPTPGALNNSASSYQVAGRVSFDPPAGIFSSGTVVTLFSEEEEGTIRYTLDGSPPELSDPVYSGPLTVESNTVIRARQWADGYEPGDPSTSSYIISEGYTMPVISLVTDPDNLWDDQKGIYVTGTNGVLGYCENDVPRNWNQDWERPMSLEYFDLQGGRQLQIDGGVKIHGGCSRQSPMKSLGFFARSKYGSNAMNYKFFREKEEDSFKGLILRNAGNDYWYSFIRDAVVQASVSPFTDLDHQAYEPVQVFINGEYWGIHNLREKVNEHWVTTNYGIPAENLDFIKNFYEVFAGSSGAFLEIVNFLENNSLVQQTNYDWVAARIDIDSYMEYLITQFFFANRDWPGNNQKYWRDRVNNSKWRWILFDMEFSMGLYDFNPALDMFSFATADDVYEWPNPVYATLLIRRLLDNSGFRKMFLQKYMMHLNTTFQPERIIQVIDSLYLGLYDAYPAQIERWGLRPSMDHWENEVDELRQFALQRPGHVWNNMRNFFSLGDLMDLRVTPLDHTGDVFINGVRVPPEGMEGQYASGFGLNLFFQSVPGYRLSHWQISTSESSETILFPRNSVWRYNDTGIYPGDGWMDDDFDDSSWPAGEGELGYGDQGESTILDYGPDEQDKRITYYFRRSFEAEDPSVADQLSLRLMRDDGAVVYINGTEVLRDNMPGGEILPGTFSVDFVGDSDESAYFTFTLDGDLLRQGSNTIAVEIHQNSPTSSDISFDLELAARSISQVETKVFEDNPLILVPQGALTITPVTETVQLEMDLHINEFMASNQGAWYDEFGNNADWIEIYNAGEQDVDMAGFYFTDNLEEPGLWRIPSGNSQATTIGAADYLVFLADGNPLLGPLHLDFRLASEGEALGLSYRSGEETIWIDTIRFGSQVTNISRGRYPDGSGHWIPMAQFTPGSSNVMTSVSSWQNQAMEISLFPVPAQDHLNIHVKSPGLSLPEEITLQLYDLTGRRVLQITRPVWGNDFRERIDVSTLPDAIYLLVFETGTGRHTRRFVKSSR